MIKSRFFLDIIFLVYFEIDPIDEFVFLIIYSTLRYPLNDMILRLIWILIFFLMDFVDKDFFLKDTMFNVIA